MYQNICLVPSYKNEISAQIVPLATMQLLHPASVVTFYLLCICHLWRRRLHAILIVARSSRLDRCWRRQVQPKYRPVGYRHSIEENLRIEASFCLVDQVSFPGSRGRRLRTRMRPDKVAGPNLYENVCRVCSCWGIMGLQNATRSVIKKLFAFCIARKSYFWC
jgi:hypothetical protein